MGCCECIVVEREMVLNNELNGNNLEIIPKSEEASTNFNQAKGSDLNTVGRYHQRTSQRTPTDINVVIMKLPDNSSEISIGSWKNNTDCNRLDH